MLGVCYYPEHWPEAGWQKDAEMMRELGLTYVRIGEFAWSRLEPTEGDYQFEWLDRAIETLAATGLKVILGTPTATPPKWLIDTLPDALPVDIDTGAIRGFGSRRHYDFSSVSYLQHALRISDFMAERYGKHPAVVGWQTDNELCCHDTALSGSYAAKIAFQQWLKNRYQTIDALNKAWGNVFWSMEYNNFEQVELPLYAVTETSPAARLDYRRFSSDQVAYFHDEMIKVIRKHSPDRFITHNFIPMNETYVDNFDLAQHLDFASYDNYPLGRSDLQFADWPAEKFQPFMRTGHPDFACYYHDQTRGLTNGGFWIMEQQPGPVNWAGNNPNPAPDMVKLWSMEAFAHGADTLCYFRWRQAPFAQEQMHAGLLRPNSAKDTAYYQAEQVRDLLQNLPIAQQVKGTSPVAIVTSAEAQWVTEIERQSDSYDYNKVQFSYYSALRKLGLNVDFISTDHDLDEYRVVLVPALPVVPDGFLEKAKQTSATVVFGPRSGAKTDSFNLPDNLAPGKLQQLVNIQITAVETTRPDCPETLVWNNKKYESHTWREMFDLGSNVVGLAHHQNNDAPNLAPAPVLVQQGHVYYLASLTCDEFLKDFFRSLCKERAIGTYEYGEHVRVVTRGKYRFAFNYESHAVELPVAEDAIVHGNRIVAPRDFAIWQVVG